MKSAFGDCKSHNADIPNEPRNGTAVTPQLRELIAAREKRNKLPRIHVVVTIV
jgi:hypothetical protein